LSSTLGESEEFQKSLAVVVKGCLESNLETGPPEAIFEALAQSRADLAFALTQKITETVRTGPEAQSLLEPAWNILRAQAPDLGVALSGSDAHYTRTLLKTLYLALQAHAPSSTRKKSAATHADVSSLLAITTTVQEVLAIVVAQGFRSLTKELLDNSIEILPADFALIIAIMRTALQIPDIPKHPEYLVTHFTHDGTARYACTLISWADQLAIKTNEPLYGELGMTFLTELSTVPGLAESIATGDTLAQISSANLIQIFRREGGFGPFTEPRTMYAIWTRTILPLALNLLTAVGAPVAAEVSAFLNQFRAQLIRSSSIFDEKPSAPLKQEPFHITLAMASDVHSMALLVSILDRYRDAGPSAGIVATDISELAWNRQQVKGDLEDWLARRGALRENIVATTEREEVWAREKVNDKDSGAESRLEEKIVDEMTAALAILGAEEA
jgi:nuclear pore complex protein Nup188